MKSKKFIVNSLSAFIFSFVSIISGLIIPRLMIQFYGSDYNGLFVSAKQYISYFYYLEAGLGASILYRLFKPIANNDYDEVSSLITSGRKQYSKIGIYALILIGILSIAMPVMPNFNKFEFFDVLLVFFLVGIAAWIEFFTASIYRVLLTSNQQIYIVHIISTMSLIINLLINFILIINQFDPIFVLLSNIFVMSLRYLLFKLYVIKKYRNINYKSSKIVKISGQIDALLMDVTKAMSISFPVVALSMVSSLLYVSVFSIYNLIFAGLKTLIHVTTSGVSAHIGKLLVVKDNTNSIKAFHKDYEFTIIIVLGILYSSATVLITPFMSVYVKGIEDSHFYIDSYLAFLFIIWGLIYNLRIPYTDLIYASGKFKQMKKINIVQMILTVVFSILFGYYYGIFGILYTMIGLSLINYVCVILVVNKYIISKSYKDILVLLFNLVLIIFFSVSPFVLVKTTISNFFDWFIYGIIVFLWSLTVSGIFYLIKKKIKQRKV